MVNAIWLLQHSLPRVAMRNLTAEPPTCTAGIRGQHSLSVKVVAAYPLQCCAPSVFVCAIELSVENLVVALPWCCCVVCDHCVMTHRADDAGFRRSHHRGERAAKARDVVPPDRGHRLFIDNDRDSTGFAEF